MENELEVMARDIAGDMVQQEGVDNAKAFDPATILIIIQIISFLFNLFKKKNNTPEEIQSAAKKSNFLQRAIIKSRLKRYMKENSDHYERYEEQKDNVLKVSLRKMANTDTEKLKVIMNEVPNIQSNYLV